MTTAATTGATPAPVAEAAASGGTADAGTSAAQPGAEPRSAVAAANGDAGAADGAGSATPGSWSKPRQATNRSGEGTARKEHWRAAKNIHGDQVDGDKVGGHKFVLNLGGKPVVLPELSPDLADPVRFAFVKPDNWEDLRRRFKANRTAIVRGRAGHGKDANAIWLLHGEVQTIYHLAPTTSIAHLADSITAEAKKLGGHEGGIGFLLCQPIRTGELSSYTFHALHAAFSATNARLVITVPADAPPIDRQLERYVLELSEVPVGQTAIIREHLSWLCNDEEAAKLLEAEGVKELIEELRGLEYSCRAAADLAWYIHQEWVAEGTVTSAGVWRRQRRRETPVHRWFDGLRTADERSFAIALAVLDGLSYDEVSDAARRLRRRFGPEKKTKSVTNVSKILESRVEPLTPTAALLEQIRARTFDERIRYSYGLVPTRTVRYLDDEYPKNVIDLAWQGHHIQPTLIEWLGELIRVRSEPVRFFAASTLGVLSRHSFDYLRVTFTMWANSDDYRVREAVAYALLQPVEDPALSAAVRSVVAAWYSDHAFPNLQATAARAYGIGVGGFDTATLLDKLRRLATVGDYDVAFAIGDALADLVLVKPEENGPLVLRALLDWFDVAQAVRPAQLAFIILANSLVEWVPRDDNDDVGAPWPMLLHLARTVRAMHDPLFALWAMVIAKSVLFDEALDAITGWAGLAENDPAQLDVFERLILQIAQREPRTHNIFRGRIKKWIDPYNLNPLPNAERAVSRQLARLVSEGR